MLSTIFRSVCTKGQFEIDPVDGLPALGTAAFAANVERVRDHLLATGVATGDVVLFQGAQSLAALATFWATVLRGAIFAPVDPSWPAHMLRPMRERMRPRLCIVEAAYLPLWSEHFSHDSVVSVEELRLGRDCLPSSPTHVFQEDAPSPTAAAAYLCTSGSTGDPKIVVLSHAALARSATLAVETFAWERGERLVNLPQPHTMSGLRNAFVAAPLAGMQWVCAPPLRHGNAVAAVQALALRPHRLVAAPLLLRHLNILGSRVPPEAFATLKAIYCTGASLPPGEARAFNRRCGVPVVNYYGLTESAGLCISQDIRTWSADDASLGRAVGCRARVVDAHGQDAAEGELQVDQPCPMTGYLLDPAATAAKRVGPWLRTGDLVRRDAAGNMTLIGRTETFIKTPHTEKIYPQEIETVLELHEGVAEAAVCGLEEPCGTELIGAVIVAKRGRSSDHLDENAVAAFVRERLGPSRVPRVLIEVSAIPRTSNGKIKRNALRSLFPAS